MKNFAKGFPLGHWSFLGTRNCKLEGQWDTVADVMVDNFKDTGHPAFRDTSVFDRGFLRKVHDVRFTSAPNFQTQSFFFRTSHSANQVSISGAAANWCDELIQLILGQFFLSVEKPVAKVKEQSCRTLEPEEVNSLVRTL